LTNHGFQGYQTRHLTAIKQYCYFNQDIIKNKRLFCQDLSKGEAMNIRSLLVVCCLCWVVPADSGALTVEEIVLLKQNGISEQTIQMMLQSEIRAEQASLAGKKMGVKTISRPDGGSAIVYSTGTGDRETHVAKEHLKEEQAWEMLRHIIVDTRQTDD
jgi:hypothetical protein